MNTVSKAAALVGAAEANEIGYPDEPRTSLQLHIEAIRNVSDYTGIPIADIDGVFSTGWSSDLVEHLGLQPKYIDTTSVGGCSFQIHVHHALCAIYSGVIDTAVISHGENGWSQRRVGKEGGPSYPAHRDAPSVQMVSPYGLMAPPSYYAHAMVRHNHDFGTTPEDFAHVAVVTREWATRNPRAVMFDAADASSSIASAALSTKSFFNSRSSGGYPVTDNSGKTIRSAPCSCAWSRRTRVRRMFPGRSPTGRVS